MRTRLLLCAASVLVLQAGRTDAQTETNLHSFSSAPNVDNYPRAGLVQGSDSNFYGTTESGGTYEQTEGGTCGTVFRISPSGTYTTLYSFVGYPNDGCYPFAGLVLGSDGNFYGTTAGGGPYDQGTVFRISPSGSETNLHSFSFNEGGLYAGLVQGSDSNFYGTTLAGGTNYQGSVFRISPGGVYTTLYSFAGPPNDGDGPKAALVRGTDGNFYGTTEYGGTTNCSCGTVFRISPGGTYTSLYSFANEPDGNSPVAGLVQGSDGNFYGTTPQGGMGGNGTVFRISPSGTYTSLYSFGTFPNDGANPSAGLVQGSDGDFYGTTQNGGTYYNSGTVFLISPSGIYLSLYSFDLLGGSREANPQAALVQGNDGNFYGTTSQGGTSTNCFEGCGAVFKLTILISSPPLCPIIYSQWSLIQFSSAELANLNVSGPLANPSGDGIPNLMKFALGGEPYITSQAILPQLSVLTTNGNQFLQLSYYPNPCAINSQYTTNGIGISTLPNLNYTVEVSGDLTNWYSGFGYTFQISPEGQVPVVVIDWYPISANPQRFMRLQVSQTTP